MQTIGNFVFKGLEKKNGGEFTNERGQLIKYPESYQLKVDEIKDGVVSERKLKVSVDNDKLVQKLMRKNIYDKIDLQCEIEFGNGSVAKVVPIDLVDSNNKQ